MKLTAETLPLYEKGQEEMAFASKVDVAFFGWFASEGTGDNCFRCIRVGSHMGRIHGRIYSEMRVNLPSSLSYLAAHFSMSGSQPALWSRGRTVKARAL